MKWIVDNNVLFAALQPAHPAHVKARAWMDKAKHEGWGVAVETFLGVVRLLMNAKSMGGYPLNAAGALALVRREFAGRHPGKIITGTVPSDNFLRRAQGHKQIMDFYYVNVAFEHSARLATMDAGILAEWPELTLGIQ